MKRFSSILFLLFGYTISMAQVQPITMLDAVAIALEKNYQIQIFESQIDISARNNTWLATGLAPSLSVIGNSNINYQVPKNGVFSFQDYSSRNINIIGQAQLNWVLFNGFQIYINKDRLSLIEQQSAGNATIVIENTIQATILAYLNTLLQQERLDVLKQVMDLSEDRYSYERERRQLGTSTTFVELQFRTAYLSDSTNYLLQEVNYETANTNLKLIMATGDSVDYLLTDTLQFIGQKYELSSILAEMSVNNNTLKNQYVNAEIFKKQLQLSKRSQSPTLSLNSGIQYSKNYLYSDEFPTNLQDPTPTTINHATNNQNYYANFTLSWNVFNGMQVRRDIQNSKVQEHIAQLQIDDITQTLNNQMKLAYDLYDVQKRLVAISNLNIESSGLSLQLAEDRLKRGLINSLDYRVIQLEYLRVALNRLQAIYNAKETETEMLRLSGGIIDEFK